LVAVLLFYHPSVFSYSIPPAPILTLFPYTTLFRSYVARLVQNDLFYSQVQMFYTPTQVHFSLQMSLLPDAPYTVDETGLQANRNQMLFPYPLTQNHKTDRLHQQAVFLQYQMILTIVYLHHLY